MLSNYIVAEFEGEYLGMRNPWRLTYDADTDQLFAVDVGQFRREEIDEIQAGHNYGYPIMEGDMCFIPSLIGTPSECKKNGLTKPIYAYSRAKIKLATNAVILGPYYRNTTILNLKDRLLFSDFTGGFIDTLQWYEDGKWSKHRIFNHDHLVVTSFGQDEDGEVYVTNYMKKGGAIYKFTPNDDQSMSSF